MAVVMAEAKSRPTNSHHHHRHYYNGSLRAAAATLLLLLLLLLVPAYGAGASCGPATAMFAFGDSTVDSGNNNFLATAFKSNFPPYGRDFFGHVPTGRFTNGRLATDFAASYLGVKDHLPPYLDSSLGPQELMTGVSFASAGSGYDLLTSQISGVIPVPHQLGFFEAYRARLALMVGEERARDIVRGAVFLVSAGTNDFVVNYFTLPVRRKEFSLQQYETLLLQSITELLQGLLGMGAEKIVVAGLPPMGCLPVVITLDHLKGGGGGGFFHERGCVERINAVSRDFNARLQRELQSFSSSSSGRLAVVYADIYNPIINVIADPARFGFQETRAGCCGTGLLEAAFLCNHKSMVCPDASKYVFWDSIHPTEKAYEIVFDALRPAFDRAAAAGCA